MSVFSLIQAVNEAGISLKLEGENLKIAAPKGALTEELKLSLKENKESIIDYFKNSHIEWSDGFSLINSISENIANFGDNKLTIDSKVLNYIDLNSVFIDLQEGKSEANTLNKLFKIISENHFSKDNFLIENLNRAAVKYQNLHGICKEDSLFVSSFNGNYLSVITALVQGAELSLVNTRKAVFNSDITLAFITPNVLVDLIEQLEEGAEFPSLKRVVCSGGVLSQELVSRFYNASVSDKCSLHYGHFVHEELSFATLSKCEANGSHLLVPIGKPLSTVLTTEDSKVEVVDGQGRKLPAGVVGSLSVNGNQTGDQVRELNDGRLEWLSHKGGGIYYEGHYLNNGELEQKLESLEGVRAARVIQRTGTDGRNYLQCYLTGGSRLNLERLLSEVSKTIPSSWLLKLDQVTTLPLSGNGEIADEQLLKLPVLDQELQDRWQKQLESRSDITEAAVVRVEEQREEPVWHLNDVLSGWQGIGSDQTVDGSVLESQLEDNLEENKTTDRADAYSPGGDLEIAADAPQTMTEALLRVAKECPERGLIFYKHGGGEERLGYDKLLEEARCHLSGLQAKGLKPGDAAIIQVNNLREYFPLFWGCVLGGIRPVTVAVAPNYQKGNNVVEKLHSIWQLLEKPPILASKALLESLSNLAKSYPLEGLTVYEIDELKGDSNAEIYRATPDDIIFYQLSSGSTGTSKCIQERHGGIVRHANAAAQFNDYSREDVGLNWLPMDHVVPILTCHLKDTYLGCDQVEIQTDEVLANPLLWLDLIEKYKVDNTWAPNFAFKLVSEALSRSGEKSWDLSSIKNFMNAGEQVTLPVVEEFLQLTKEFGVKEKTMQPAFGMAEVCTCMTYRKEFSCADGVSYFKKRSLTGNLEPTDRKDPEGIGFIDLGGPVNGVEIRITDSNNKLVKEGVIGRFQIRGGVVTPGYLKNPEANEESFVGDDWFNSGDLGFIWEGHLYLTGREKEQIIVNGANFYCYEIEDVVNATAGVEATWSAACGVMDDRTGTEGLAVFYVPSKERKPNRNEVEIDEEEIEQIKQVRQEVTTNLGISPTYVVPVSGVEFPKTTSGKIQRTKLRNGLLNGDYSERLQEIDLGLRNHNTIPAWFYKKEWVRKQACGKALNLKNQSVASEVVASDQPILVFGNDDQINLFSGLVSCIGVSKGDSYKSISDARCSIREANENDINKLISELVAKDLIPNQILFLWPVFEDNSFEKSALEEKGKTELLTLLGLAKALAVNLGEQPISLRVVTQQQFKIQGEASILPEHTILAGFIKALAQEHTQWSVRIVDTSNTGVPGHAQQILEELSDLSQEYEVALRQQRWVPRLAQIDYTKEQSQAGLINEGGLYLITGGLGGIGLEVARFLQNEYKCKLLLVGRTPFENLDQEKRDRFAQLRHKTSIVYNSVDITDVESLDKSIKHCESELNSKLNGVFHLAGVALEKEVVELTEVDIEKVLAPKVTGTKSLHEILVRRDGGLCVNFSSVNGFFGGMTTAAYSAANSFLDAFTVWQNNNGVNAYVIDWSMWQEIGISRSYADHVKALSKARGYIPIDIERGIASLKIILSHSQQEVMVGLEKGAWHIDSYLNETAVIRNYLEAYFIVDNAISLEADSEKVISQLKGSEVDDCFGTSVTASFISVPEIPKDDDGQVDFDKLRLEYGGQKKVIESLAPRNELEKQIWTIWQEALGASDFGIRDNFFQLGGHSLLATQVISRVGEIIGQELSVGVLFESPTVETLALRLQTDSDIGTKSLPLEPISRDQELPMSYSQQRHWFMDQLDQDQPSFHMPFAMDLKGKLNIELLQKSLNYVVANHESLRTVFTEKDGKAIQIVKPKIDLNMSVVSLLNEAGEIDNRIKQVVNIPFDLKNGPLIRTQLFELAPDEYRLLVVVHHIIFDGWSVGLLVKDIVEYYKSAHENSQLEIKPKQIEFADFAKWQHESLNQGYFDSDMVYWANQLAGLPSYLKLPTDKARPEVLSPRGDIAPIEIDDQTVLSAEKIAKDHETTLYNVLISVFQILLYRTSGLSDIFVGSAAAGRHTSQLESIIGNFTNLWVLRSKIDGSVPFSSFLSQTKENTLKAHEHLNIPFDLLVERLSPERSLAHSPLFQVMFLFNNTPATEIKLPGVECYPRDLSHDLSDGVVIHHDLSLGLTRDGDKVIGAMEFSTDLFDRETINRMLQQYVDLLKQITLDPSVPLEDLQMISISSEPGCNESNEDDMSLENDFDDDLLGIDFDDLSPDEIEALLADLDDEG